MPSGDGERDVISIHALRKESDRPVAGSVPMSLRFQSTLSVRRATRISQWRDWQVKFQSTLSVRRATGRKQIRRQSKCNFNPRSP